MAQYINKDAYVGDTGKQLKDIKTNADDIANLDTRITDNTNTIDRNNSVIMLRKNDEPIAWSSTGQWNRMPFTTQLQRYGNSILKSSTSGQLTIDKDVSCIYAKGKITFNWSAGGTHFMFFRVCKNGTPIAKTITTLHRWGSVDIDAIIPVEENDVITFEVQKADNGTVNFNDYTQNFGGGYGNYCIIELLK